MSSPSSSPAAVSNTDFIACPACNEPFTSPPSPCVSMSLLCGHCVCAPCLEAVTLSAGPGEASRCPICTSACGSGVLNSGVVSLLEATGLKSITQSFALACSECAGDDAIPEEEKLPPSMKCKSCKDVLLCEVHGSVHRIRCHTLRPLDRVLVSLRADACPKHPAQELSHVCLTDDRVLCLECVAYDHPITSHEVNRLEEVVRPVLSSRLSSLRQKCVDGVSTLTAARDRVCGAKEGLVANTERSIGSVESDVKELKAALDAHVDVFVREAREVCADRVKALDAQLSELSVSIEQLKMGIELCDRGDGTSVLETGRCVEGVSALSRLSSVKTEPVASDCVDILFDMQGMLESVGNSSTLRLAGVDSVGSELEGSGVLPFTAEGFSNVIRVRCFGTDGKPMGSVSTSDVSVVIHGVGAGGVPLLNSLGDVAAVGRLVSCLPVESSVGVFDVAYVVECDVSEIQLEVRVCGVLITGECVRVPASDGYTGGQRHVRTLSVFEGMHYGLALSRDEKWMVVTSLTGNSLNVYSLPDAALVRTIGSRGTGPREFDRPFRACWSPLSDSNILVCDYGNNRVQEIAITGEHIRSIPCKSAVSIDCNADVMVVGCDRQRSAVAIRVFGTAKGELIREIGSFGEGPAQIGDECSGIRLTRDGRHIVIAELLNARLSQFSVDGEFVRHIGVGQFSSPSSKDVAFTCNNDIIVADSGNLRVLILSWASGELVSQWGEAGDGDGQFRSPLTCVVSGSVLYVMDWQKPRVQVFE